MNLKSIEVCKKLVVIVTTNKSLVIVNKKNNSLVKFTEVNKSLVKTTIKIDLKNIDSLIK